MYIVWFFVFGVVLKVAFVYWFPSPFDDSFEGTSGIDMLCSKVIDSGNFEGHLKSVSWSNPNFVDICISKTCAHVKKSTLEVNGTTVDINRVWTLSEDQEKLLPKPGDPVRGFYFFDLMRGDQIKRIHLYMQDKGMMMKDDSVMWTKEIAYFTLVHGPPSNEGAVPYMFAIDLDDQTKRFIFFSMTLDASNDYNVNLDQRDKHYFVTWAPGFYNTLRLVPKPLGAPKWDAFSMLPKGFWADVDNGTVFLLDDELGCVFAVADWSKELNLSAKYDQNSKLHLDFKVIGTPYEAFFHCPEGRYSENSGLLKSKDILGNRCNVIGKEGEERGSKLSDFSMVGLLVLLAILGLMVFIACKYAKGLLSKRSGQDGKRVTDSKSANMKLTTPTTTSSKSSDPLKLQSSTDTKTKVGRALKPKAKIKAKIKAKG